MNYQKFVLIYGVMVILSSCQTLYVPQHVISPMHEKKGDAEINVQGLFSISGSASYAFTDNFFAGVSANRYQDNDTGSISKLQMNGLCLDVGYYSNDKESKRRFELMGGLGIGNLTNFRTDYAITRVYLQPSIGFVQKKVESIVTLRLNGMYYSNNLPNNIPAKFNIQFIEPTYTFRGGGEKLKFHAQMGFSIPIKATNEPSSFAYFPMITSMGVSYKFNLAKKKIVPEITN